MLQKKKVSAKRPRAPRDPLSRRNMVIINRPYRSWFPCVLAGTPLVGVFPSNR